MDWLNDAGFFGWLLLALSVISLTVVLERFWSLRRAAIVPPGLVAQMEGADAELRVAGAASATPLGRLVGILVEHLPYKREDNAAAVAVAARREVLALERGLVIVEIIVGIAPLLGLVGTIYGIIPLFGDFGKAVAGDNTLLAKGIGAALNKTLLGLMVAIPSLACWSILNKRVEARALELESYCDEWLRRHYLKAGRTETEAATAEGRR